MKNLTLRNIANSCNGKYFGDEEKLDLEVVSVTTDSREAKDGCLFIAIKGQRSDGHDYIDSTFENGALCVVSEKELPDCKGSYILVKSSLEAIKKIAMFYRSQLSVTVVGITGSVGKTSTKETVASVLSEKFNVLKTLGNFNNELGLPLTIFRLTEDDEVAVLEMGISDFGEMHRLSEIAKPDMCIITNIGICHLENLKTRDGILKAKSEIFDFMNPYGTVVLNGDDDKLKTIGSVYDMVPDFFGLDSEFDVWADNIQSFGLKGTVCLIHTPQGEIPVHIPVPGKHMVHNALAAATAGVNLGLGNAEIKAGIEKLQALAGRNNIIFGDKYTVIDDCYNANPVSMKASIDVLNDAQTRKVAILGDMGELGEKEKSLHFDVGCYAGESAIDVLYTIGTLTGEMVKGFLATRPDGVVEHFDTVEEFLNNIDSKLQKEDSVLVKASHFMKFDQIVNALK